MLVVGLGNPGSQYALTRHNLGWRVVELLVTTLGGSDWRTEAGVRWSTIGSHWIILPNEYMNDSGGSLKKFCDWKELGLEPSRLLVVHDDLDLPLGTIKPDVNRSAGGHRGVQSIIDVLHTQDFHRLRLGLGSNREVGVPAEAYVLERFRPEEIEIVNKMMPAAVTAIRHFLSV